MISKGLETPAGTQVRVRRVGGQGMECLTPHKPLPVSEGKGIPSLLLTGKSRDVCGHLPHHKHIINKQQRFSFSMTTIIVTTPTASPPSPPPPPWATVVQLPPTTAVHPNDDNSVATPHHRPHTHTVLDDILMVKMTWRIC